MKKLYIIGLGPGGGRDLTGRAAEALEASDVIVGYTVYIDLIREDYGHKDLRSTPMRKETERCQMALEEARKGKTVAMVCSGDSGIYGMAALIYELRGEEAAPEVEVIPGLTAACSGAALLGAPLTHDFAVIILSDRLTDWQVIEKRLRCAAQADLSIVLYNPASRGRPDHLLRACEILLEVLPKDRPCAIARNIGRDGESRAFYTLEQLRNADADMFCTVFIGNGSTKMIGGNMVTPRGYRDV